MPSLMSAPIRRWGFSIWALEYLAGLNERYEKWISEYKGRLITIDADNLDFLNREEDFAVITDKIDAELYGLFPSEQ